MTKRTRHHCKLCISDFLCLTKRRGVLDHLAALIGLKTLRCEHCHRRYYRFTT